MEALLIAFAVSLGAIFVAELGDKSQLMALAFATRFKPLPILIGITAATALVHLVSVVVGHVMALSLPTRPISIVAGLAFFGFGAWTLRGDELDDEEERKAEQAVGHNAVLAASGAFFLAELGDKTMLATITLASKYESLFGIWLGSTVGMVLADALAIWVGSVLHTRLPERAIKIGAAVLFFIFGTLLLLEGILG